MQLMRFQVSGIHSYVRYVCLLELFVEIGFLLKNRVERRELKYF